MQLSVFLIITRLTILHAGSLSAMMDELSKRFIEETGIEIVRRAGGSLFLANLIKENRTEWDIFFSADYNLLQDIKGTFCDIVYPFASNQIVLAYTPKSKHSNEIEEKNWIQILTRKGVRIGRSNPELDPCGYRALLLIEIIKSKYGKEIAYKILHNSPEKNVRPKASEVANLLEIGELDYAFLYLSEAITRKLLYIDLGDSLNFGNPELKDYYRQFTITLKNGKVIHGDPIVYGFCINKKSKKSKEIGIFLEFWKKYGKALTEKYNLKSL